MSLTFAYVSFLAEYANSPGVHWQRDPRSRVYNFPPHLENIPNVLDFAFERLQGFVSSSRDNVSIDDFLRLKSHTNITTGFTPIGTTRGQKVCGIDFFTIWNSQPNIFPDIW